MVWWPSMLFPSEMDKNPDIMAFLALNVVLAFVKFGLMIR